MSSNDIEAKKNVIEGIEVTDDELEQRESPDAIDYKRLEQILTPPPSKEEPERDMVNEPDMDKALQESEFLRDLMKLRQNQAGQAEQSAVEETDGTLQTTSVPPSILSGGNDIFDEEEPVETASAPAFSGADAQSTHRENEPFIKVVNEYRTIEISKQTVDKILEQYTKMGLSLYLLDSKGKKPTKPESYPAMSISSEHIKEWIEGNPRHNIGIATGEGVCVFRTASLNGFENWLKYKGIEVQETAKAEIGSYQFYYFKCDTLLPSMILNYGDLHFFGKGDYLPVPPSIIDRVGITGCEFVRGFEFIQPMSNKILEILKGMAPVLPVKPLLQTGCHNTVSLMRGVFLPYKKIKKTNLIKEFEKNGKKLSFENSHIKVEITMHLLTQIHANILDVMMTKFHPTIDGNGDLYVECTLYELQKHLGLKWKNNSVLIKRFIDQMIESTVWLYIKTHKVSYGFHIVESIKKDEKSGKFRIVFNKDFINSYFKDTLINYKALVDDILSFKYSSNQAVARFLISQKHINIWLENLLKAIGIDTSNISRVEKNKVIRNIFKEKELFEKLGITITSNKKDHVVFQYVKHKKVYFNEKLRKSITGGDGNL